jgi:hypothetical protein
MPNATCEMAAAQVWKKARFSGLQPTRRENDPRACS